jgi:hypothetical protein
MAYLFFGLHIISTSSMLLLLYLIPYIVQATIANAHIQGPYRHTFWAEVYETVLAWYITLPTTVALIAPKLGKFNVTAKGGLVEEAYFDSHISRPYVLLVLLNLSALLFGLWHLFFSEQRDTVALLLNLVWTLYSVFMLGAAMGWLAKPARCGACTVWPPSCRPCCTCPPATPCPRSAMTSRSADWDCGWHRARPSAPACTSTWACGLRDRSTPSRPRSPRTTARASWACSLGT